MYKKKKILSIITARAQSKGLKNKNLKKLNKKPIFLWPVKSSLKSKLIDQIIITTDSKKILNYKMDKKIIKINRPEKLSNDNTKSSSVILHAINYLKKRGGEFDYLILLEPTSPLTNQKDIDYCLKKLINDKNASSLLSLQKLIYNHPAYIYKIKKKYIVKKFKNIKSNRRQDLDELYSLDGSLYISKTKDFLRFKDFTKGKVIGVEFNKIKNFEIDNSLDLKILNKIFRLK